MKIWAPSHSNSCEIYLWKIFSALLGNGWKVVVVLILHGDVHFWKRPQLTPRLRKIIRNSLGRVVALLNQMDISWWEIFYKRKKKPVQHSKK